MKWIVSDFFARSPALLGPVVALVLFMFVFAAVAVHALRTQKADHDRMARLPLKEDAP
jgi:cbb3-type cytochrome oxidase subunit 3